MSTVSSTLPRPNRVSSAPVKRSLKQRLAAPMRWLHIYASMFGLISILFFSATGFLLNHPDFVFGDAHHESTHQGEVPKEWLAKEEDQIARLNLVEHFRNTYQIRAALEDFQVEDSEIALAFRGPGYSADAYLQRDTGSYELTQAKEGVVAIMSDLHRGRHTGAVWSWVIDVTAIVLMAVSLTGLGLLLYLKKRRRTGVTVTLVVTVILVGIYYFFV